MYRTHSESGLGGRQCTEHSVSQDWERGLGWVNGSRQEESEAQGVRRKWMWFVRCEAECKTHKPSVVSTGPD